MHDPQWNDPANQQAEQHLQAMKVPERNPWEAPILRLAWEGVQRNRQALQPVVAELIEQRINDLSHLVTDNRDAPGAAVQGPARLLKALGELPDLSKLSPEQAAQAMVEHLHSQMAQSRADFPPPETKPVPHNP